MRVRPAPFHRFPESVADLEHFVVFGVDEVLRKWQRGWIVGHQSREVLIDQTFEAGSVAVKRDRAGRRIH